MASQQAGARVALTTAQTEEMARTLASACEAYLEDDETFGVVGEVADDHLIVTFRLASGSGARVWTWEVAKRLEGEGAAKASLTLLDFFFRVLEAWLQEDRWPNPHLDWKEYTWEGLTFSLRGEFRNEELDAMADAWLQRAEGGASAEAAEDDGEG